MNAVALEQHGRRVRQQRSQAQATSTAADPAPHLSPGAHPPVGSPLPTASVGELQRAWRAVAAGQFQTASRLPGRRTGDAVPPSKGWVPAAGEQLLLVLACPGSPGATTVALALATAAASEGPARLVECSSITSSGLVAACTAELGADASGWLQGRRGEVLVQRCASRLLAAADLPAPMLSGGGPSRTVLDVAWPVEHVLVGSSWLKSQLRSASVVLVTSATVPGVRHLEVALALLEVRQVVVAVVGPPRRRWPPPVRNSLGRRGRAAERSGSLVRMPWDAGLAVRGLDAVPLPTRVLAAADDLWDAVTALGATERPAAGDARQGGGR